MLKLCSFLHIMPLVLKVICFVCLFFFAKWEKQVQNLTGSCRNTSVLVSQAPLLLYFAFFVLHQRCLSMLAGCGMIYSCKLAGGVWLTTFDKIANYGRYCDQHHIATSGPAISCQTASFLGRLSLRYQSNRKLCKFPPIMPKIMLAQSIKSLWLG